MGHKMQHYCLHNTARRYISEPVSLVSHAPIFVLPLIAGADTPLYLLCLNKLQTRLQQVAQSEHLRTIQPMFQLKG